MWGIVPAAGIGSRIQPLAFSKELLPVGSRQDGLGAERPRAVSEYLVERMIAGGATRICFVISPRKADIVEYFGGELGPARLCYVVQPEPQGLCDSVFRALPFIGDDETVLVGLPDTIWFPLDGFRELPEADLSFLLFPVSQPEHFDAVVTDGEQVREIQVKRKDPATSWIWGAFKVRGRALRELHSLWLVRDRVDPYLGTLVNAWLAKGRRARALKRGTAYVDTGTLHGYREAMALLASRRDAERSDEWQPDGPAEAGS